MTSPVSFFQMRVPCSILGFSRFVTIKEKGPLILQAIFSRAEDKVAALGGFDNDRLPTNFNIGSLTRIEVSFGENSDTSEKGLTRAALVISERFNELFSEPGAPSRSVPFVFAGNVAAYLVQGTPVVH